MDYRKFPLSSVPGAETVHPAKPDSDNLSPEIREQQLLEYEINNRNYLRKLNDLENKYNKMENKECFYYKLSTLYYGICITQKTIQWCQHIRMQKPLSDLIQDKKS